MSNLERIDLSRLPRCPQYWSELEPTGGGRLCTDCRHTIVDFRHKTDREIAEAHVFSQGKVCGFYTAAQLRAPRRPRRRGKWTAMVLGVLGSAGTLTAAPDTFMPLPVVQSPHRSKPVRVSTDTVPTATDSLLVRGRMVDAETDEPLMFATVVVEGTRTGTNTDLDGRFCLDVTEFARKAAVVTLLFNYTGYENRRIRIESRLLERHNTVDAALRGSPYELKTVRLGSVHVETFNFAIYTEPQRPMHRRVWQKVGNFFRKLF